MSNSIWFIRLPTLILGIAILYVSWKLMQELEFSNFQQTITSFLIAFIPGLIWVSQDARAYNFIIILYLIALFYASRGKWLGYFGAVTLLGFSHATGFAFAASAVVYALYLRKISIKRIFLLAVLSFVCWLPWLKVGFFFKPSPNYLDTFWLGQINLDLVLDNISKAFFVRQGGIFLYPVFVLIFIIGVFGTLLLVNRKTIKGLLIVGIPLLIMVLISRYWKNVIFYRTLIPLLIPLALWVGMSVRLDKNRLISLVVSLCWVSITILGVSGWNPLDHGGKVKQAAETINSAWQSGDVLYYGSGTVALPFDYYLTGKPGYILDGIANSNMTPPTLLHFERLPLNAIAYKRVWLIYPEDMFFPEGQLARLQNYALDGKLVSRIDMFGNPDILVYLIEQIP